MVLGDTSPETEPLLVQREEVDSENEQDSLLTSAASSSLPSVAQENASIQWHSLASLTVIILFYLFSNYMLVIPALRLYENAVCRQYYHKRDGKWYSDIDEGQCKIPEIQSSLATLIGWKMAFDALPGLLTAVWYGNLADRYGRKPVLIAAMLGEFTSLVWIFLVCMATLPN
jgi:MFS family permease